MISVEKTIQKYQLFQENDIIGVAVSGGTDSMSLLHYLYSVKDVYHISLIAITVDHGIREASKQDAAFVVSWCNSHEIPVLKFTGKVKELNADSGKTLEQSAREYRYGIFDQLLKNKTVNKIALGHHLQDQAETILLNIFRGSGILGAGGMEVVRDGVYLRPLLKTPKSEILAYVAANDIPYVEDETNQDNEYARNYIRNQIMPLIRNRWKNADQIIANFGEICKTDEQYIQSTIHDDGVVVENDTVKIPVAYFVYHESARNRIMLKALKSIGVTADIETKHLDMVTALALTGQNNTSVNLPNKVVAIKEYNYLTFTNKQFTPVQRNWDFKIGKTDIANFGTLDIKRIKDIALSEFDHIIDLKKLPKSAVWRYKEDGDVFEKFGGGTKMLSDYLTDKKIPRRLRTFLPVLASGKEVYIIAGVEISDKVKADEQSKNLVGINAIQF